MTVIMLTRVLACRAAFAHGLLADSSDAGPEVCCSCQRFRAAGRSSKSLYLPSTADLTTQPRDYLKPEPACGGHPSFRRQASRQGEMPDPRPYFPTCL